MPRISSTPSAARLALASVCAGALAALVLAWPLAVGAGKQDAPDPHGATLDADSPAELLDRPARAWTFTRWLDTRPLTLEGLRGKVVLVRWFNTGCRFCANTLPALEELRRKHASEGLVVVGVFHPKPVGKVSDATVRRATHELGFTGPVAVDEDWSTLNRWWLANHPDRNWTSVSFLMDREGVVRWAQGGGEYHPSQDPRHAACNARHAELERTIQRLLGEHGPTPRVGALAR